MFPQRICLRNQLKCSKLNENSNIKLSWAGIVYEAVKLGVEYETILVAVTADLLTY